ncbi:MAG: DUF2474 domain-containing protein [Ottowia sp.]|nr:DUF2474 domain-containing protein [Ottowia sp.]
MARHENRPTGRLKRFGWFVAIWAGSVLALGVVAVLFRLLMDLLGLGG